MTPFKLKKIIIILHSGSGKKKIRTVSGAPVKAVRQLFLGHTTSTGEDVLITETPGTSHRLSLQEPVSSGEGMNLETSFIISCYCNAFRLKAVQ